MPEPRPNWDGLLEWFRSPVNPLYEEVRDKVAAVASRSVAHQVKVTDQWQNLKDVLSTPNLRDPVALAWAVGRLAETLDQGKHSLSGKQQEQWNDQIEAFNFPGTCKLAGGNGDRGRRADHN
ncbi:MAG: hypothetical protein AAFX78_02045 [Cyanobacteria bacterium J06638_20]